MHKNRLPKKAKQLLSGADFLISSCLCSLRWILPFSAASVSCRSGGILFFFCGSPLSGPAPARPPGRRAERPRPRSPSRNPPGRSLRPRGSARARGRGEGRAKSENKKRAHSPSAVRSFLPPGRASSGKGRGDRVSFCGFDARITRTSLPGARNSPWQPSRLP